MDLDYAITFLVLASAAASARASVKNKAWRWLGVQLLNVVALGAAWLFARGEVTLWVGPLWGVTVLAPGLATTLADRYARAERFSVAHAFARIAATLHPNATTRLRARLTAVQALEVQGKTEEAKSALEAMQELDGARTLATLMRLRIEQDWEETRRYIEAVQPALDKDPVAISFYLRALGELDEVDRLLEVYAGTPHAPILATVEGQLMLFAASFAGREDATGWILRAHHAEMPADAQRLWLLTAARAAGRDVTKELEELARTARPRVAAVARRRLETPLPKALSDEARARAAELERAAATLEPARPARPTASAAIALVNLYAFVREIPGGATSAVNLHKLGALYTGDIEAAEAYRLFTATVLHYGSAHVAMNVLGLLVLGPRLEAAIGRTRLVLVYLASGIGANALAVLWTRQGHGDPALLVGASGAVMGVAGGLLVRRVLRWIQRRTPLARREVLALVAMFLLQIVFDAVTPHVAGAVHLFGAGVGALCVLLFARPSRTADPVRTGSDRIARGLLAVGTVLSIGVVELAFRAASNDASPSGECAEGDVPSCAEDCAADLGPAVLDGGAPGSPRFRGKRGALLVDSCNRWAYALSNGADAGDDGKRRAYQLYAATCDAGSMVGCTNEGVMLVRGDGVATDLASAKDRFGRACTAGHPRGCTYLADELRHDGRIDESQRLFERACDAGDGPACRALGSQGGDD